jgi:hypothetical protein
MAKTIAGPSPQKAECQWPDGPQVQVQGGQEINGLGKTEVEPVSGQIK